jgi:predicted RNase H-like HicB family nuclease
MAGSLELSVAAGAVTRGRDLTEAREMLRDVVQEMFSVYRKRAEAELASEGVEVAVREPLGF